MSKGAKARANIMIAKLELRKHNGATATFLKQEGQGRESLGLHWVDKDAVMKAKRRLYSVSASNFHVPPRSRGEACGIAMNTAYAKKYTQTA